MAKVDQEVRRSRKRPWRVTLEIPGESPYVDYVDAIQPYTAAWRVMRRVPDFVLGFSVTVRPIPEEHVS